MIGCGLKWWDLGTFSADCISCEWRATSVCGVLWILARLSGCNTFLLSVCIRSSERQCGVYFSVSTSPRVILVGTVVWATTSFVFKVYIDSAKTASNSDVAAAVWVAGYYPRRPSHRPSLITLDYCLTYTYFVGVFSLQLHNHLPSLLI